MRFLSGFLLSLILIFSPPRVVEIMEFKAEGNSGYILVTWATASETDNAYFELYRDTSETGDFSLKVAQVWSKVPEGSVTRTDYDHVDNNVKPGVTYYYKLKTVAQGDDQGQWHDEIVSAVATPAPTATPTLTSTPTETPTATPTPTATATATPTPVGTSTPTVTGTPPATPTTTPTSTPTSTPAPTPTPTATLRPGETPAPTATPTPTTTPQPASPTPTPTSTVQPSPTATPEPSSTPTRTPFPTVPPPSQAPSLGSLCVGVLSYGWFIAGAAVLLVLTVGFIVLMTRGRGEP